MPLPDAAPAAPESLDRLRRAFLPLARAGLGYKWQFSKTADFTNDLSYSYDLSDSKNWIFSDKAAVTAALTSVLSLKASYTLLYNHEPVPTFRRTDTATAVALVAKL